MNPFHTLLAEGLDGVQLFTCQSSTLAVAQPWITAVISLELIHCD